MKHLSKKLIAALAIVISPVVANAAGTYYTGTYQSPQRAYTGNNYSAQPTYVRGAPTYAPNDYSRTYTQQNYATTNVSNSGGGASGGATSPTNGFFLDGHLGYESSMWETSLNTAGSILSYNNIDWLTLNADMTYRFDVGDSQMEVDAGLTYGMQSGESTMTDDDITRGGYLVTTWVDAANNIIGNQVGHALSIGTSDGGSMLGFHAGLGFTDAFQVGAMKITPSFGYRYDSYSLQTSNNYGLSVDTAACFETEQGEIQCDPAIIVQYADGSQAIIWRDSSDGAFAPTGGWGNSLNPGGTYYFAQPGVSHAYDVTWAGPYVAMQGRYDINADNYVTANLEIGLPAYTATGDQPYRFDWAHPKSVEDTAGIGSALHFAFGADYNTAITDSVMLSVGLTYDYYSVSGASASTYLNSEFYLGWLQNILDSWVASGQVAENILTADVSSNPGLLELQTTAQQIVNLEEGCPDWVCTTESEIESFFKSVGIKVGFKAKF